MIPKYLYHYTKIDTLKAIIESKNIRFKRLDLLNDPLEGIVKIDNNFIEFRKKAFCSCWTPEKEESMLMWSMYTGKNMDGVRIKMNSCMFATNFSSVYESDSGFYPVENIAPVNYEGYHTQTEEPVTIHNVYGPIKIQYVDMTSQIYEKVISSENLKADFQDFSCGADLKELGIRKLKCWIGEKEWRYMIWPFSFIGKFKTGTINNSTLKTGIEYIDVPYKKDIEEIILGPGVNKYKNIELSNWLDQQGIRVRLIPSSIKIKF